MGFWEREGEKEPKVNLCSLSSEMKRVRILRLERGKLRPENLTS